jgi:PAS domain S-box-containing protein
MTNGVGGTSMPTAICAEATHAFGFILVQEGASMAEQSKLAERILDQVADAVIYVNQSGTIMRWNHASIALFGYSADEALGQSVDLIIPEHLRAPHWSGFNAAMKNGVLKLQGRPTLTRALHKSGRRIYVEMTFAIVKGDTESEVLGSVAMARDVTERIEQERAARRSS